MRKMTLNVMFSAAGQTRSRPGKRRVSRACQKSHCVIAHERDRICISKHRSDRRMNVLENAEPALRHPSDAPASEGRNRASEALEKIKPGCHARQLPVQLSR